jgi:hypothetical protein
MFSFFEIVMSLMIVQLEPEHVECMIYNNRYQLLPDKCVY